MSGRNNPRSKAGPNAEMDTAMAAAHAEGAATERKRILDIVSCDSDTTLSAAAGQAIDSGTSAAAFATAVIKTSAGDNRGEAFMIARRGLRPRVSGTSGNRGKDYVQAKQGSPRADTSPTLPTPSAAMAPGSAGFSTSLASP